MPPTAASYRHAVNSLSRANSHGSLLPFLYCTRTIRRQYSSSASKETADGASLLNKNHVWRPPPKPANAKRRNVEFDGIGSGQIRDGPSETDALEQSEPSDRSNAGDTSRRYDEDRGYSGPRQKREWVDHVPFERPNDNLEAEEPSDGTTITPSERRAFEKLKAMQKPQQQEPRKGKSDKLDETLTSAFGKEGQCAESSRKQSQVAKKADLGQKSLELQKAVEADLYQIDKQFEDAPTDASLWRRFESQVMARVLRLELDQPKNSQEEKKRKSIRRLGKLSKAGKKEQAEQEEQKVQLQRQKETGISDLDVLTETLPQHVLALWRHCRKSFPSSSLPLNLMPYLKSTGPTTFTMAASTVLYNNHMRWLYRRYLDLPGILATLEEMDRQVYEFDYRTYDFLVGILRRRAWVLEDNLSGGAKALWESERITSCIPKIGWWLKLVEERLQQKALREAREASEAEEAEEKLSAEDA